MMQTKQQTLNKKYTFEGKGLHTGKLVKMVVCPAPENTGVIFKRVDISDDAIVEALAENVSSTARSTTISKGEVSVSTIEHIMSALTGLGVDNAIIEIDNVEVPILDGSAKPYIDAMAADGTLCQEAPRQYITIPEEITIKDEKSGSEVTITPADSLSFDVKVDFGSKVLGVQNVHWDMDIDYTKEVGVCRTFCFFHEIEFLFKNNLVKGGDMDNAIVVVEHPVSDEQLKSIATLFNLPLVKVDDKGYLNNLQLRFPDECGRHKLLDIIGDIRLCGGFLNAKITAFKPGHTINTNAAKLVRQALANVK